MISEINLGSNYYPMLPIITFTEVYGGGVLVWLVQESRVSIFTNLKNTTECLKIFINKEH